MDMNDIEIYINIHTIIIGINIGYYWVMCYIYYPCTYIVFIHAYTFIYIYIYIYLYIYI